MTNHSSGRVPIIRRAAVAVAAVTVIVVACWYSYVNMRGASQHGQPQGVYFAHEETGDLSVQPMNAIPPLLDDAGKPLLVRACLYSTDGGKTKIPAYYEKYSDAAKQMSTEAQTNPDRYDGRLFDAGRLVRLPAKGSPWVPAESAAGQQIQQSMPTGDNITPCSAVLGK